jgi:tRNA U34 2-thiouridine synthase MnmA/TrmU
MQIALQIILICIHDKLASLSLFDIELTMKKHVVCAISGSVDSAVAAYLLLKQGYKVTGCSMKNWDKQNETVTNITCQADLDKDDVCDKLKIPFIDFNFTKEYWTNVFR